MDDFGRELQSTPLRGPSAELDARIARTLADASRHRRGLPLRWAAAALLAVGLLGYLAGNRGGGDRPIVVKFEIVRDPSRISPFDYTNASDDGLKPMAVPQETKEPTGA